MNIAAARVLPVRLRFAQPLRTAQGEFAERTSVLLELRDADGVAGYGEAAPWPGFGTESVSESEAALRRAERRVLGAAVRAGDRSSALEGLLRGAPAARAALQGALWDLGARRAGLPLAEHLAARTGTGCGAPLSSVAVSALLTARAPQALRAEASRARATGHRAVKVKLGSAALTEDVARLHAVRDAIGPSVRLRGDANGAWTVAAAQQALAAFAPFDMEYVEQPVAAQDIDGLAQLRRRAAVRVAADESAATEQGLLLVLASGAADVVVLKPATLGGPARALELAGQVRNAGMGVVFTHAFETAVGAWHALHCAAAWGDAQGIHGLMTAGLFETDVAEPVGCSDGIAAVARSPGLGITL